MLRRILAVALALSVATLLVVVTVRTGVVTSTPTGEVQVSLATLLGWMFQGAPGVPATMLSISVATFIVATGLGALTGWVLITVLLMLGRSVRVEFGPAVVAVGVHYFSWFLMAALWSAVAPWMRNGLADVGDIDQTGIDVLSNLGINLTAVVWFAWVSFLLVAVLAITIAPDRERRVRAALLGLVGVLSVSVVGAVTAAAVVVQGQGPKSYPAMTLLLPALQGGPAQFAAWACVVSLVGFAGVASWGTVVLRSAGRFWLPAILTGALGMATPVALAWFLMVVNQQLAVNAPVGAGEAAAVYQPMGVLGAFGVVLAGALIVAAVVAGRSTSLTEEESMPAPDDAGVVGSDPQGEDAKTGQAQ